MTTLPAPGLTYRTIGGLLEFFVFMGPRPEEVVEQYTRLIGRTVMPAYWSLGFQICRYGYNDTAEIVDVVDRNRAKGIPQATDAIGTVDCTHIYNDQAFFFRSHFVY